MEKRKLSRLEVAQILESFLSGAGDDWDWDDFTTLPLQKLELDRIRRRCAGLSQEFPSDKSNHYCNEAGLAVLRSYIVELRK